MSTRLMRRRMPLLPHPTPPSGAPAAKGPSYSGRRMVSWEAPHHPCRESVSTKGLPLAEGPAGTQSRWRGEGK